jgi:peptidoglycan/LPS O-acetylase OafA/YrhL
VTTSVARDPCTVERDGAGETCPVESSSSEDERSVPAARREMGQRMFALDMLRGVAIWLVLIRHLPFGAVTPDSLLALVFLKVHEIGWCGVDLFFVLSGYLISGLLFKELQKEGRIDIPRFWLRRGLKIWPSYFIVYGSAIAMWCAYSLWRGNMPEVHRLLGEKLIPNLVFVQNYLIESQWPHSWSLAVEEHFYLLLPILIAALATLHGRVTGVAGTRQPYGLVPVACGVALGILALRLRAACAGASWMQLYYPTHHRADSLFYGVLLRFVTVYHAPVVDRLQRGWPILMLSLPVGLAIPLFYPLEENWLTGTVGFTALYLGFGSLVFLAGANPNFGRSGARPFTLVARGLVLSGVYSYTIYLSHSVVSAVYEHGLINRASPANWVLFLVASIGGGIVVSHIVERPFLRLRERWLPSLSAAALSKAATRN